MLYSVKVATDVITGSPSSLPEAFNSTTVIKLTWPVLYKNFYGKYSKFQTLNLNGLNVTLNKKYTVEMQKKKGEK